MEMAKLHWISYIPPMTGDIICQFNPESLTISKGASWEGEESPNFNSPYLQFAGGQSATYQLSLFFDSYSPHPVDSKGNTDSTAKDVREYTNALLRLTMRGAGNSMFLVPFSAPPVVNFIWGKISLFTAVVENVQVTFTMFSQDGLPIRAKADVSFKQQDFWDDLMPAQNPTSRTDSRKTRRVTSHQRLDQIANEEYGDSRYWRLLAEANNIDDPFQLVDGQLLVIPQDKK